MDSISGKAIHGNAFKHGFDFHEFIQTTLVEFYSMLGDMVNSRRCLTICLKEIFFAWTTMISAHVQNKDMNYEGILFDEMP